MTDEEDNTLSKYLRSSQPRQVPIVRIHNEELMRRIEEIQAKGWKSIETAPRDGTRVCVWNNDRDYYAIMVWNGHDWECVRHNGEPMGMGFTPAFWREL